MDQIRNGRGGKYVISIPEAMGRGRLRKDWPVVLINGDEELLDYMMGEKLLPLTHAVSVMAISLCRQDDFTPWPEPSLSSRFPDFGGRADSWLGFITREVLPGVREEYPVSGRRDRTGILGQSLGGIAALYTQMTDFCDDFGRVAAISPSCWYPGFLDRFQAGFRKGRDTAWYVSCGTAEGAGSSDRKRDMVAGNQKLLKFLTETEGGARVASYWDDGGHRDYPAERFRRAFLWMEAGFS